MNSINNTKYNDKNKTFKCWRNIQSSNVLNSKKSIKKKHMTIKSKENIYSIIHINSKPSTLNRHHNINLLWFNWVWV